MIELQSICVHVIIITYMKVILDVLTDRQNLRHLLLPRLRAHIHYILSQGDYFNFIRNFLFYGVGWGFQLIGFGAFGVGPSGFFFGLGLFINIEV